jgi:iron complex outermembrane receptor protein
VPPSALPARRRRSAPVVAAVLALAPVAGARAQAPAGAPATLDAVQIREQADGGAGAGYAGPRGGTAATRTETPLIEVPQAVRVVPRQLIDDLQATRLGDTVDYVSGIARLNDFGGTWDNFAIRGFSNTEGGSLLNGFPSGRGYGPQRDVASVERIEFLKGPAAALYGSSEPGGTINVVTKKPQFTAAHRAGLQVGGLGFRRATLDTTGPLGGGFAYRLNAAAEDGASRSPLIDSRKQVLAPALTWALDGRTVLQYEAEIVRIRAPLDRGLVQVGGDPGVLPRDRFLGEPSRGNMHIDGDTHQLTLDRELAPGWRARLGGSYRETRYFGDAVDLNATLRPDNRTLVRRDSWRSLPSRDAAVQAEIEGAFRTGGIGHTVLAGVESWRLFVGQYGVYSNPATAPYAIDIYQPAYGQARTAPLAPLFDTRDRQRATGVFVQDQIDLSAQWKLLAGVRFDRFHQDYQDLLARTAPSQAHAATSPRLGLTYRATERLSFYASAGKSFRPNAGGDERGNAFDPQSGRALEAGAKWLSADERLNASLAVFDIRKDNVLTRSPTNAAFNVAAGQARSRGAEADLAGQLDAHWRVTGNLAYTDTEVTRDNNPALRGRRLANIPRASGAVFAIREDRLPGAGGRYGIGGGLVHVGERTGNATDTYRLPAYTTARLTAYWQVDPRVRLTVDVHNLFDKTFYAASWNNLTVLPGLGRQVVAGLQAKF